MSTVITRRAWVYLSAMMGGVALAVLALVLAGQARADRGRVDRLANDDLVLAVSVADARLLAVQMQLGVTRAVLLPSDHTEAGRFATQRALIKDDLRRARLHARDHNTVDVVDDLDNRALAYAETAEKVYEALTAGHTDEARSMLAGLEGDGAEVNALADELYTVATASADAGARGLSRGLSSSSMLALALAGLVFAVLAGTLAWAESGVAIVSVLALVLPYSVVQRLVKETESTSAQQSGGIVRPLVASGAGDEEPAEDDGVSDWASDGEESGAPPANQPGGVDETRARQIASEMEQNALQLMEEIGPQPARAVTFDDDQTQDGVVAEDDEAGEEPQPIWRPRAMQKPANEAA